MTHAEVHGETSLSAHIITKLFPSMLIIYPYNLNKNEIANLR